MHTEFSVADPFYFDTAMNKKIKFINKYYTNKYLYQKNALKSWTRDKPKK